MIHLPLLPDTNRQTDARQTGQDARNFLTGMYIKNGVNFRSEIYLISRYGYLTGVTKNHQFDELFQIFY